MCEKELMCVNVILYVGLDSSCIVCLYIGYQVRVCSDDGGGTSGRVSADPTYGVCQDCNVVFSLHTGILLPAARWHTGTPISYGGEKYSCQWCPRRRLSILTK